MNAAVSLYSGFSFLLCMLFPTHTNATPFDKAIASAIWHIHIFSPSFYHSGKFAACTWVTWKLHNYSDRQARWPRTSALVANNLPLGPADSPALHRWREIFQLASLMPFTFPEGHVRQLLLMVHAKMLHKALPRSHFSLITADDIKTWVTPPTNQDIQSLVSTVQVMVLPGDRRWLGCYFLTSPRQALVAWRKAQTAGRRACSSVTEARSCEVWVLLLH